MQTTLFAAALVLASGWQAVHPAASNAASELIPRKAVWKYQDANLDLGTAWRSAGYDDSSWTSGPGILGYGESFIATTLQSGRPTYYFRATFALEAEPATVLALRLSVNYDDGFVAYVNGTEVVRASMPSGDIDFNTPANSHESGSYELFDLSAFAGLLTKGSNVLAVEVHNRNLTSSDIVFDASLDASAEGDPPQVLRGPYLNSGADTRMVVRWRSDIAHTGAVRFGVDSTNLDQTALDSASTREHEVLLSGLLPDTRYTYSIGTETEQEERAGDQFFVTNPLPGTAKATRVWIIGDSGTANDDATRVYNAYKSYTQSRHTDLWVMLGDNAYSDGTDAEFQAAVFDMYPEMLPKSVLWPAFGNHDGHSANSNLETGPFYDIFTLPRQAEAGGMASNTEAFYSFDYGTVHFICLNSHDVSRSLSSRMLTWLRDDLAQNDRQWTVAFWHHPPYSKGSHDSDREGPLIEMRENALPLLEAGGVDLAFFGHSHSYERSYLLDGHYGNSLSLLPDMVLDTGNGRTDGDGAYAKRSSGPAAREGAVYVVAGSSGKTSGGSLDHPVMYMSLNVLGSLVLDVDGNRADLRFLDDAGVTRDYFTLLKGQGLNAAPSVALTAPAGAAEFLEGTVVDLTVSASDTDGQVVQVEFFVDSTSVGLISDAPYATTWTAAGVGAHVLWAEATDDSGAVQKSEVVTITVNQATGIETATGAPVEKFELSAVYPNPFNPSTSFSLAVAHNQHVRIDVVNLLGHRVAVLYDAVLGATPHRTFTFAAADLQTGVYLLRVRGETFFASRKLLLLK